VDADRKRDLDGRMSRRASAAPAGGWQHDPGPPARRVFVADAAGDRRIDRSKDNPLLGAAQAHAGSVTGTVPRRSSG
jgi:hypothetical protein